MKREKLGSALTVVLILGITCPAISTRWVFALTPHLHKPSNPFRCYHKHISYNFYRLFFSLLTNLTHPPCLAMSNPLPVYQKSSGCGKQNEHSNESAACLELLLPAKALFPPTFQHFTFFLFRHFPLPDL
ncbi:hypothetical protein B0T13DRAFT_462908 [Neurospora crassa]|nr:hypothetical protein B0T13DRAFT_462908 [Neurospora crassa]